MQSVVLVGQSALNNGNGNYSGYQGMNSPGQSFFMGGDLLNKNYYHQISPRNNNQKGEQYIASATFNNESLGPSQNLGNVGQYTFKGKRTGINQSSSLQNNQPQTQFSIIGGPNNMFQVQQTQNFAFISNEKQVNQQTIPYPNGVCVNSGSMKQTKQLLNKQYKKQLLHSDFMRQSSPITMPVKNQNQYAQSISKKLQNQQMLYVAAMQQTQQQKFQQDQRNMTHSPSLNGIPQTAQNQSGPSQSSIQSPANNLGSLAPIPQRVQGSNTIVIISPQQQVNPQSSIFGLPSQTLPPTGAGSLVQPPQQLSPKQSSKQVQSHQQQPPIQRYTHASSTLINQQNKHQENSTTNMQAVAARESFNMSGVLINSSKKHREFMKAQELSKGLVLNGTPAPNANNRGKEVNAEIDEPNFQENAIIITEAPGKKRLQISEYSDNINGSSSTQLPFSQLPTVASSNLQSKRNTNQVRHQSSSNSQQRTSLNVQPHSNSSASANPQSTAQRAGSASTFSQQLQNNGQRLIRQGSEKTQRREQSAGSRLNSQQMVAVQQTKMPMMINSYHTNIEKQEKNNEQQNNAALSTSFSQSNVNIAQSTQGQSQNGVAPAVHQSFSSFNGDLVSLMNPSYLKQGQSQTQSRSHSVDLNKESSLTDEDNKSYGSNPAQNTNLASQSITQATGGGGGGCGCDDLSQVSEESAFEEDDYEEQKEPGSSNPPKVTLKKNNDETCQDDGKKSKKVTIKILASMPNNAKEEEEAFFASNFTVNPVFEYDNPMVASRFISQFKKPRSEFMTIATKIMDAFLAEYGSESNYFLTEGRVITDQEETEEIFKRYLEELDVLDTAIINFSEKIVAPTSVTYDNYSSKIRINIQVPIEYREGRITGVLHHEIGTHFLRRFNEIQQPWHGKRKKYGLKSCIAIEEGMGCINMMLEQAKDVASQVLESSPPDIQRKENFKFDPSTARRMPFLFKPALNYYACYKASEMSFVELFNDLEKYVDNPKKRWKYVLRVKRGLGDTSQPGGLYKDQVYLEGAIKILKNRKDINFKLFYCGKINIEDIKRPKFIKKAQLETIIIPKFMEDMKEYKRILDVIAKVNFID